MVFRVLRLEQGIQFHYLTSWTGYLFDPYMLVPTIFKKSISTLLVIKKNFCMGNEKQGRLKTQNTSKIPRSLVLNGVAKWTDFVLNRVRVWRPWRHTPTQTSLKCPSPGFPAYRDFKHPRRWWQRKRHKKMQCDQLKDFIENVNMPWWPVSLLFKSPVSPPGSIHFLDSAVRFPKLNDLDPSRNGWQTWIHFWVAQND